MDATKPTDVENVSAHPAYIRETRAAVNALSAGSGIGVSVLEIPAGSTSLSIGTDLGQYGFEVIILSGTGPANISIIYGGVQGQVKVFIAQDNNISFVDGSAVMGHLYLNQLPALSSFAMNTNDILAIANVGGDGAGVEGYWKELFRQVALK